ncbi:MAG TPA: hypothetical protein VEA99_00285 [Gemmatimonadaceae bacterium]|nr:hypothetical protein [Gemmatimonadaceae bacterium]
MRFSLRHWRAPHLLGAWIAYWLGLAAVQLGPLVRQVRRVMRGPEGTGSFNLGFSDSGFEALVREHGRVIFDGGAGWSTFALAVAGPPLLLWLAWLASRPRRDHAGAGRDALGAGPWSGVESPPLRERDRVRRDAEGER